MKYNSSYEIAEKYSKQSSELSYPASGIKPRREQYKSNAEYGVAMDEWEANMIVFRERRREWSTAQERINQSFKKDLLEFLEVSNHPQAEKLWLLAWEHGHSSGYGEVANYAEEFVELMR